MCTADGIAYSVMVGVGEYFFVAFALAAGQSESMSGFVTSVAMLAGAVLQSVNPLFVRWLGSCRRWVVITTTLQSLSFVPLIVGAVIGRMSAWMIFVSLTLYWFSGLAGGPAWNLWMERAISRRVRARYFADRSRWCQAGVFAGLVAGGILLGRDEAIGTTTGFAVMFGVACAARVISTILIWSMHEPEGTADARVWGPRVQAGAALRARHFLAFVGLSSLGLFIAQPFLNPYFLRELGMESSPAKYTILLAAAFAGRILAAPYLGRLAVRKGAAFVLRLGVAGLIPAAALMPLSDSIAYLIVLQLASGAAWAAHELGLFLLIFEAIPAPQRTRLLTVYNIVNCFGITLGSALGAQALAGLGEGHAAYVGVFLLSAGARVAALVVAMVTPGPRWPAHPPALEPHAGVDEPITASLDDSSGGDDRDEPDGNGDGTFTSVR